MQSLLHLIQTNPSLLQVEPLPLVNDRAIALSAREFLLAEVFLRHPGQVLTREQLLDRIWGYDYDPGTNIVNVYVGHLRKKLGEDCIETVRGMGYRLRI